MLTKKILSPGDSLGDAFAVRIEVFVNEQGFSRELEIDETDNTAVHVVFYDGEKPVATGRVFADADKPLEFHIGRVAIIKRLRGDGLGNTLMQALEDSAKGQGASRVRLGAQCRVRGFYEKRGYKAVGGEYMDEHCPHIYMEKNI